MGKHLIDDRYELRDLLGSGGMAEVFLAYDGILERDVALKLLKKRYTEDKEFVERFRREARSAAALTSPYVVPIFDRGETADGTYYIVMEYVPGGTLKDRLKTTKTLPPHTAAEVALQTAEALHAAHQRGVIHRDVKPDNILSAGYDHEHVKVADFGIARATEATTISRPGDILGSVKYMSPEQAAGERIGPTSDLYSLGVVLYEMLTGSVPFAVDIPQDVPLKHAEEPPPPPSEVNPEVPQSMDAVVMGLLKKDPSDRYGSAAELIEDLRTVRDGLPSVTSLAGEAATAAMATPPGSTLPQPVSNGRASPGRVRSPQLLAALVACVAVLGVIGWFLLPNAAASDISEILKGVLGELSDEAEHERPRQQGITVPEVEGLREQEARERLVRAQLRTESRHRESSEEDAGRVLEQSVRAGEEARKGSRVFLTVGKGSQATRVPDLTGLSYPEAERKLEKSGYLLGGVREEPSNSVPAGMITEQDPPPGTPLDANSYVYLSTSVGPSDGSNTSVD